MAVAHVQCAGDAQPLHRLAQARSKLSQSERESEAHLKTALSWTGRQVVLAFDRGEWTVAGDNRTKGGSRFEAAAAGALGPQPLVPYLPLAWSLGAALIQRRLLLDTSPYAPGCVAVVVACGLP